MLKNTIYIINSNIVMIHNDYRQDMLLFSSNLFSVLVTSFSVVINIRCRLQKSVGLPCSL